MQRLKKIRVGISLFFFAIVTFLFLDLWEIFPTSVTTFFVSLQLIPSLTKILTYTALSSLGLGFVLLLTLLFGRVYCSSICPLGTLQDVVIKIAKRNRKRRWFKYRKPYTLLHYSLFGIITLAFASGSLILLNLVEPFSNYGRIISNLFNPLVGHVNNAAAFILGKFGLYTLHALFIRPVQIWALIVPVLFLAVVVYMSYNHGRLFCNTLCPAGAFLGILSRVSFFKIVVNEETCTECKLCEKVCKANCIESGKKMIDFSQCVSCFNCIDVCPSVGLKYENYWKETLLHRKSKPVDESRRQFMGAAVSSAAMATIPITVANDSTAASPISYGESRRTPVTPPGSRSTAHFTNYCTACHLCVTACPPQVLYPSFIEYGIAGVFQPRMNYNASYCNYDCTVCGEVCPSGAILPLGKEAKKLVQIGKAAFVKDDCIVITKKKDCGACSEHCPTKAVHMIPYEGKLMLPELNNDICVGCGACEHACPTVPRKAIYVTSNTTHQVAKKPQVKKVEGDFDNTKDFPF
ncbi:MAG: 4Fe-4S dicluster domain-containing protein [bacterium]